MTNSMAAPAVADPLLDFAHLPLIADRNWRDPLAYERIGYEFVRNAIAFDYNEGDELPASSDSPQRSASAATGPRRRSFQPGVEWTGDATLIQKDGLADDFGLLDGPDQFYARHGPNLCGVRRSLYTMPSGT